MSYINVQRMLTGALLDKEYRKKVVRNPFRAAAEGFNGETFTLEADEVTFFKKNRGNSYGTLVIKAARRVLHREARQLLAGAPRRASSVFK
jgi:hypothetical protein